MSIIQDCGFDEARATQYIEAVEAENYPQQLKLLKEQREVMLNKMHVAAQKVDCLDYVICECQKNME